MIDDLEIPMWSADDPALREEKRKRNDHWMRMRLARGEYIDILGGAWDPNDPQFWKWLEDTYGIVPMRDNSGDITAGYSIVDEKKYTIFLLKFSH